MQITYRQYPHPVLKFFENDYKNSEFKVDINTVDKNDKINLNFNFLLKSRFLKELIKENKASYVVHIECSATRYREKFETFEDNLNIEIHSKNVSVSMEVCILIIAKTEIENFMSDEFNSYFKGIPFKIELGDVLGIYNNLKISIEKSGDSLKKVPSIFSIVSVEDSKKDGEWSYEGNKILIRLYKENYKKYRELSKDNNLKGAIAMMIVVPVITEIVSELKQDFYTYDTQEWFKVINKRLEALSIDENSIKSYSSPCIAYKILNGILSNSFEGLEKAVTLIDDEGDF